MRIFRTTIAVAHLERPDERRELGGVMVDTGSEYNWIPRAVLEELRIEPMRVDRFATADRRVIDREIGFALVSAGARVSPTIVVFAEQGDMVLLGAHGLEGMNLRVDLATRELVPGGPMPVALLSSAASGG